MLKQYSSAGRPVQIPLGSLRSRTKTRISVKLFCSACLGFSVVGVLPAIVHAIESKFAHDQVAPKPSPRLTGYWNKAKASWYTGPTDRTADGTRMDLDGQWVATRLVPMGATVQIRNKSGKVWTIKRRDTPAKENGHRLDLPKGFWRTVTGAKYSRGLVAVEWRLVK